VSAIPRYLLGLDVGGTVVKVALFQRDGTLVAAQREMLPVLAPDALRRERDPDALWSATARAIRNVLAAASTDGAGVAGIGLTGYGNGLCLVDAQGQAVTHCILSSDRRAHELVEDWRVEGLDAQHRALTFQELWPGKPLPLLAWMARHAPDTLARAAHLLCPKDLLRLRLTGRVATDVTDAASSSLLAGHGRDDFQPCFKLFGLDHLARLMPVLAEPTDLAGTVSAEAALDTGLKAGTPVSVGLSDNAAMLLGSGAVEPGDMNLVAGTWGLHHANVEAPNADGIVLACCQHTSAGQWLAIEGSPASASAFEWFLTATRTQARGEARPDTQAALYAEANDAVVVLGEHDAAAPLLFLPHMNAAFDDPQARGAFLGLSSGHGFGHMVRAVYEGIAFEHRLHMARILRLLPTPQRIRFAGGAANSAVWAQIFADVLEQPLEIAEGQEIGALGAVMTTAVALGWHPDLASAAAAMTRVRNVVMPQADHLPAMRARFAAWHEARTHLHALWRGPAFVALAQWETG